MKVLKIYTALLVMTALLSLCVSLVCDVSYFYLFFPVLSFMVLCLDIFSHPC
jgi:hypothetical protein